MDRLHFSSAPIAVLEEIFSDANIHRSSVVVHSDPPSREEEFGLDFYHKGDDSDRMHADDFDDEYMLEYDDEPLPPQNHPRKRRAHNSSNLSLNQSQHHPRTAKNGRGSGGGNDGINSHETIHWQSLRNENCALRFKITKLAAALQASRRSVAKRRSQRHFANALGALNTSLTSTLHLSLRQTRTVKHLAFARWSRISYQSRQQQDRCRRISNFSVFYRKRKMRRNFKRWHDKASSHRYSEDRDTLILLRKMSGLEKIRFVVSFVRIRKLRRSLNIWKSFSVDSCAAIDRLFIAMANKFNLAVRRAFSVWVRKLNTTAVKKNTIKFAIGTLHNLLQNRKQKLIFAALRKWSLLIQANFTAQISSLVFDKIELKRQKALHIVGFLASKFVQFKLATSWRKWVYIDGLSVVRNHEFSVKIAIVSALFRRKTAQYFFRWRNSLALCAKRASVVFRLVKRLEFRTLLEAFRVFNLTTRTVAASEGARTKAMRRLCKTVFLRGRHVVAHAFNAWCRRTSLLVLREFENVANQADKHTAMKVIVKCVNVVFMKKLSLSFSSWVLFLANDRLGDSNKFLGVNMMKRTIATMTKHQITRVFNTWQQIYLEDRQHRYRKKQCIRLLHRSLLTLIYKQVSTAFFVWLAQLRTREETERTQQHAATCKVLAEANAAASKKSASRLLSNVMQKLVFTELRRAFAVLYHILSDHKKRVKWLQFIVTRISKKKLHVGFKKWEEVVYQTVQRRRSKRRAVKLLNKSIRRCVHSTLSRSLRKWRSFVSFLHHEIHLKYFAVNSLRGYFLRRACNDVLFAFQFWKRSVNVAAQKVHKQQFSFHLLFKICSKNSTLLVRKCFAKWEEVVRHYNFTLMGRNKQIYRMVNVLLRVIKHTTMKYFAKWLILLSYHKNAEYLRSKDRELAELSLVNDGHKRKISARGRTALKMTIVRVQKTTYAAAFATLEKNTSSRHRERRKLNKILQRWGKNVLLYAFRRYENNVNRTIIAQEQKRIALNVVSSALRKVMNAKIYQAFRCLKDCYIRSVEASKAAVERQKFSATLFIKLGKSETNKQMFDAFKVWKFAVEAINKKLAAQKTMREVLIRLVHKRKATIFYSLRNKCDKLTNLRREHQTNRKQGGTTIKLYFLKMIKQDLARSFNQWRGIYKLRKDKSRTLKVYVARFVKTQLSSGFKTWIEKIRRLDNVRRLEERKNSAMKRVILRMMKRALSSSFVSWTALTNSLKSAELAEILKRTTMKRVILRCLKKNLAAAYRTWYKFSASKKRQTAVLKRILLGLASTTLNCAFITWQRNANQITKVKAEVVSNYVLAITMSSRTLDRIRFRLIGSAWRKWRFLVSLSAQLTLDRRTGKIITAMKDCLSLTMLEKTLALWRIKPLLRAMNKLKESLGQHSFDLCDAGRKINYLRRTRAVEKIFFVVDKLQSGRASACFHSWRHAAARMELLDATLKARNAKFASILNRRHKIQLTAVLDVWADFAHNRRAKENNRKVCLVHLNSIAVKLSSIKLVSSFKTWKETTRLDAWAAFTRGSATLLLSHILKHSIAKKIHSAWLKWKTLSFESQLAFSKSLSGGGIEEVGRAIDEGRKKFLFKHRLDLTNKVIKRLFNGVREAHFVHWKIVTRNIVVAENKMAGMVVCLGRICTRNLLGALRRAINAWKVFSHLAGGSAVHRAQTRQLALKLMLRSVARWTLKICSSGFNRWRFNSVQMKQTLANKTVACSLLKRSCAKMYKYALQGRFARWYAFAKDQLRFVKIYRVVGTMRCQRWLRRMLIKWSQVAKDIGNVERGLRSMLRVLCRIDGARVAKGWMSWRKAVEYGNYTKSLVTRAVLKLVKQMNAVGFATLKRNCWLVKLHEERQLFDEKLKKSMLARVIIVRQKLTLNSLFRFWKLAVNEVILEEKKREVALEMRSRGFRSVSWILERWSAKSKKDHFIRWITKVRQKALGEEIAVRLLYRTVKGASTAKIALGFRTWARNVYSTFVLARLRTERLKTMRRIVVVLEYKKCLASWRCWLRKVKCLNDKERGATILRNTIHRMQGSACSAALNTWIRFWKDSILQIKEERRSHSLLRDHVRRIRLLRIRFGWSKWIARNDRVKSCESLTRVLRRSMSRTVRGKWMAWRKVVVETERGTVLRNAAARQFAHIQRFKLVVSVARSFRIWFEFSVRTSLLSKGLSQKQFYCLKHILLKFTHINEFRAFGKWRGFVEGVKRNSIEVEIRRWKRIVCLEKLGGVGSRGSSKAVRRRWHSWTRRVVAAMKGERVLFKLFVRMGKERLREGFGKWVRWVGFLERERTEKKWKDEAKRILLRGIVGRGVSKYFAWYWAKWRKLLVRERGVEALVLALGRKVEGNIKRKQREFFLRWVEKGRELKIAMTMKMQGASSLQRMLGRVQREMMRTFFVRWDRTVLRIELGMREIKPLVVTGQLTTPPIQKTVQASQKIFPVPLVRHELQVPPPIQSPQPVAIQTVKQKLAARSIVNSCKNLEKKACTVSWKIWCNFVRTAGFEEKIDKEYDYLNSIMQSFGRLQSHQM